MSPTLWERWHLTVLGIVKRIFQFEYSVGLKFNSYKYRGARLTEIIGAKQKF